MVPSDSCSEMSPLARNSNIYLKTGNTIELYVVTRDWSLGCYNCFFVFSFILDTASINLHPPIPPQNQEGVSYSWVLLPFALKIDKFHSKRVYLHQKYQDHLAIISYLLVKREFDNLELSYLIVL